MGGRVMSNALRFALASLTYYWRSFLLLVFCIAFAIYVPLTPVWLIARAEHALEDRAQSTPLILATKGSQTDLTLSALYFDGREYPMMTMKEVSSIAGERATAIPLHMRFTSLGTTIVGTTDDYYQLRGLTLAEGTWGQRFGDCVIGASAAKTLNVSSGGFLTTDPKTIFNLTADYPLRIRVTGVLRATGTPDDDVVFVSMDTAWIMEGIGHGHFDKGSEQETSSGEKPMNGTSPAPDSKENLYLEINEANVGTFHFHGLRSSYPVTACVVLPKDTRAETLLLGQYASTSESLVMLVQPLGVIQGVLDSVLRVRNLVLAGLLLVTAACLLLVIFIFSLTFRLRHSEFDSLAKIGASRGLVFGIYACEIGVVLVVGGLMGVTMAMLTSQADQYLIRWII